MKKINTAPKFLASLIILIGLLLSMAMLATHIESSASASQEEYTISRWRMKKDKSVYNAQEGCTYQVFLTESMLTPIKAIYYSAYQVSISQENIRDNEGNIAVPFVKDSDDNPLEMIEIVDINYENDGEWNSLGERNIMFEVTAHEWQAFEFFVEWNNLGEILTENSDLLYCTNIDSSPPELELTDEPIYQDNGFWFQFSARPNKSNNRSANSGFKKITVYRQYDDERYTLKTYTEFIDPGRFYGDFLADKKGEYFIEAIDGVDNKKTYRVIEIIYDILDGIVMDGVEDVLFHKDDYNNDLIENLRQLYMDWQLKSVSADENEVLQARTKVQQALTQCFEARQEFETRIINDYYFDYVTVENFDSESYKDIVKGEKVTLNISVAKLDADKTRFKDIILKSELSNPDTIYTFYLDITSDITGDKLSSFDAPLKITLPIKKYNDIAVVSETLVNGKMVHKKLRLDKGKDWVMIYLTETGTVNIVIDENSTENLKYLYLLLLLIPIGGAIVVFILRDKIFKRNKKNNISQPPTNNPQTDTPKGAKVATPKSTPANKSKKSQKNKRKTPK